MNIRTLCLLIISLYTYPLFAEDSLQPELTIQEIADTNNLALEKKKENDSRDHFIDVIKFCDAQLPNCDELPTPLFEECFRKRHDCELQ